MNRVAATPTAWTLLIALGLALGSLNAVADGGCAPVIDYVPLADESGIGGTGRALPSGGGVGGTGRNGSDAGTGIFGTITGFASICVNGLEVHYDETVPVSDNGRPADARGLAVGQVVAVEAGNSPRGLEAKRIAVLHALVGPVTRSLDQHGQLEVMGATVALDHPQRLDQARGLKAGDWVKVSGHPIADHGVLASRVARIDAGGEVSVSGRADPERRRVGAVAVDRTAAGELTVRGAWDGQRVLVRDSHPAEGTTWAGRPARVVIETRVRQRDGQHIRTGRGDVDAILAGRRGRDDDSLGTGTLLRVTARLDPTGRLLPLRIERAQRESERPSRSATATGKDDDQEARRAPDEQQKDADLTQREGRGTHREKTERIERAEKPERVERPQRPERPERPERPRRER